MLRRDIVSKDDNVRRPRVSEILDHQPGEDRIGFLDLVFGLAGLIRNDAPRDVAGSRGRLGRFVMHSLPRN